jgi:hypothetical protein
MTPCEHVAASTISRSTGTTRAKGKKGAILRSDTVFCGLHRDGHAGHGNLALDGLAWPQGAEGQRRSGTGAYPPTRRRPQAQRGEESRASGRSGRAGGADHLGRAGRTAALDVEERSQPRRRVAGEGTCSQPSTGGESPEWTELRPPGQSQDTRGTSASGPRRAVPPHQRNRAPLSGGGPADNLRRYEEEGAGRGLQERRAGMAAPGEPEPVRVHDFVIRDQGKAIPYGIYDLARHEGWVSVGIDHDTASSQ